MIEHSLSLTMNDRLLYRKYPTRFYPCQVIILAQFIIWWLSKQYVCDRYWQEAKEEWVTWCYQDFMINNERIVEPMRMIANHVISYTAHCPNSLSENIWYLLSQEECQNLVNRGERESMSPYTHCATVTWHRAAESVVSSTQATVKHNLPNITAEIAVNLVPRLDWCSGQFVIAQTLVDRPDPPS